ncbi:hypothetical protein BaRGS_00005411 [Batillaria attramentaria]|uniref:Uncharacterized protein n=1 Tax=Batillaria attramentaria TaxID=370345 RepID=A0ABD0LWF7_9CAEN
MAMQNTDSVVTEQVQGSVLRCCVKQCYFRFHQFLKLSFKHKIEYSTSRLSVQASFGKSQFKMQPSYGEVTLVLHLGHVLVCARWNWTDSFLISSMKRQDKEQLDQSALR